MKGRGATGEGKRDCPPLYTGLAGALQNLAFPHVTQARLEPQQ